MSMLKTFAKKKKKKMCKSVKMLEQNNSRHGFPSERFLFAPCFACLRISCACNIQNWQGGGGICLHLLAES